MAENLDKLTEPEEVSYAILRIYNAKGELINTKLETIKGDPGQKGDNGLDGIGIEDIKIEDYSDSQGKGKKITLNFDKIEGKEIKQPQSFVLYNGTKGYQGPRGHGITDIEMKEVEVDEEVKDESGNLTTEKVEKYCLVIHRTIEPSDGEGGTLIESKSFYFSKPKDGKTPIKGIDYSDGDNGADAKQVELRHITVETTTSDEKGSGQFVIWNDPDSDPNKAIYDAVLKIPEAKSINLGEIKNIYETYSNALVAVEEELIKERDIIYINTTEEYEGKEKKAGIYIFLNEQLNFFTSYESLNFVTKETVLNFSTVEINSTNKQQSGKIEVFTNPSTGEMEYKLILYLNLPPAPTENNLNKFLTVEDKGNGEYGYVFKTAEELMPLVQLTGEVF